MKDYLFDSIDWQIEGVSYDNVNRIRNNKSLFKLEGQNNSEDSFLFSYDSYFIILAFLRYDLYGNKTWNYDGYEWDLYQISEWVYNCREDLIMYVKKCNNECDANYVEAAFILDTYFMILSGQFSGLNLNDICVEDYLKNDYSKNYQLEGHEKLWKDLFNLYDDYEDRNNSHYGIARKYFNLIQGGGTKVVVLNYLELESLVSKIIKNRLNYSNEKEQLNDKSSQRKNIIQKLSSIQSRLEKVANQEIDAIKDNLIIVKKYFKNSNISKQDVSNMWELFEKFYRVTNDAKMPVPFTLPNKNSVDFEKMAESYNRINILNENSDKLSILMAFSTKPEQHIKLLANIINSVEKNVATVEKEVSNSSIVIDYSDDENKYDEILGIAKATNLLLEREGIVC